MCLLWVVSDVGMRVGADYQANIPEFDAGEVLLVQARPTDRGSLGPGCFTVAMVEPLNEDP